VGREGGEGGRGGGEWPSLTVQLARGKDSERKCQRERLWERYLSTSCKTSITRGPGLCPLFP
jgi:hypothetical protein